MLSLNEASASSRRLKVCEGNLALLREKLGADPESYAAEFAEQFEHFQRHLKLLELQPVLHRSSVDTIIQLCDFLSNCALHYPEKAVQFGALVVRVLDAQAAQLEPQLRLALCKCVVRLAHARALALSRAVALLFELLRCDDKQLRKFILGSLIAFIRRCTKRNTMAKKKGKRRKRNSKSGGGSLAQQQSAQLQHTLFAMLNDSKAVCARVAQMALMEAYRRQFWRESKTANALAECVFHRVQRIQVSTMRFFLGTVRDEEGGGDDGDSSAEEEAEQSKQDSKTLKEVLQQFRHAKKTKKRHKQVEQAKKAIGAEKKRRTERASKQCNLEAIRSIYDPQRFADRLFGALDGRRNEKYAIRLLQMALCARVIGVHRLQTLGFYSYMHRYLQPKQKEVTRILLYAAQATHELVPPDIVEQMVRVIAQNFVSDHNTPEAITVGLNTIREIYSNCPAAATEEMIRDLAEYKKLHNKNVSMAARALVTLFRTLNPKLLHHRDRGRPTTTGSGEPEPIGFGRFKALDYVPGAEILPDDAEEAEQLARMANSSDDDEEAEEVDNDEDDEEGSDADEIAEDIADGKKMEGDDDESNGEENDDDDEEEEEMEGEEEGEDGWITCSDDEDEEKMEEEEEEQKAKKEDKMTAKSKKSASKSDKKKQALEARREQLARAQQISAARILTEADFRLIRVRQLRQQARLQRDGGGARKRTNDDARLEEQIQEKFARSEVGDGLARLNDIEHFHRKIRRQSKAERMEQVKEGRPDREAYGKPKKGAHVGRTNRELAKRKPAQMVRQKIRGRNRQRSFCQRQQTLRKYLLRQQGKKV